MEQLKNDILKVINDAKLPLDAKYYVVKDIYRDLEAIYYQNLIKLNQQEEKPDEQNICKD